MTLDRLRPVAERGLAPFVTLARRLGVSPDGVSVIAFGCAIGAGVAFGVATPVAYVGGAVLVFANGWLDLVDGALARATDTDSSGGDLLDHVLDRYADLAVIVGLAVGVERYGLGLFAVTGVLMTSYLGTQIQAVGIGREYGGLLGRADRLALAALAAVVTALVPASVLSLPLVGELGVIALLLLAFGVVGHLTALQRFAGAWSDLQ